MVKGIVELIRVAQIQKNSTNALIQLVSHKNDKEDKQCKRSFHI